MVAAVEPGVVDVRVPGQESGGGVRLLPEQRPLEQPGAAPAAAGSGARHRVRGVGAEAQYSYSDQCQSRRR